MPDKQLNEFRLEVGNCTIGLMCPSAKHTLALAEYFGLDNSEKTPDFTLNLDINYREEDVEIPDSLFTTKKVSGNTIDIADGLIIGETAADQHTINLQVCGELTYGPVTRVFEQLLYQAFYSCCRTRKDDSLLIHCSGVIYRGGGYLFVGPSGSGKSTIAALSEKDHHVINDEICLLDFHDGIATCHSTPFNGYYKKKRGGSAPLKAIFLIRHGTEHRISDISKSDAVMLLAKEIVPPVALMEAFSPRIFISMVDKADSIHGLVPMHRLEFLQDKGFWGEIDRLYNTKGA